jgi:hypothetical protein
MLPLEIALSSSSAAGECPSKRTGPAHRQPLGLAARRGGAVVDYLS